MILFKKVTDLHNYLISVRKRGLKIGFVPTMGALHAGHVSLVNTSLKENGSTVCSIFVNPAQFNDPKDFEKYPVTLEKDIDMLERLGCTVLFLPPVSEIYPDGYSKKKTYDLGRLEQILEGKFRPGHFQGVCMVMDRLLQIMKADRLYMGQKDYQQCMVIRKLIGLIGLQDITQFIVCPTTREPDGLAMSSRNLRLSETERLRAVTIYQTLQMIKENFQKESISSLKKNAVAHLEKKGFKTDYVEIANAGDLEAIQEWDGKEKLIAVVAAFLNEVRLIDNTLLNE